MLLFVVSLRATFARFLAIAGLGLAGVGFASGGPSSELAAGWKWNDPRELKLAGVRHGTLESAAMKRTVGFNVYLPPQYEREPLRRFPVVYFLHGSTGTESSDVWLSAYVHKEVASGMIEPSIYVFPNGGAESEYRDWPGADVKAETLLIRELIPYIDGAYRTTPAARAICGFSMGGEGALRLALKYPQLFVSAASIAAGSAQTPDGYGGDNVFRHAAALGPADRDRLHLYLVVGDDDEQAPWLGLLLRHFKEYGIRTTYVVHSNVGHNLGRYNELSAAALIRHLARELSPRLTPP